MNVISFVVWALSHAKRASVPDGAVLCVDLQDVGRDGEWEYLYGTTGRRVTQSLLDERYANYYSRKGWTRAEYDRATSGWIERGVTVCDCQGLEDYYSGSDTNCQGNWDRYCTDRGSISSITRPYVIGEAVFRANSSGRMVHIGWVCGYMPDGDPLIVEERGLSYGCVVSRLSQRDFTHRGLMTKRYKYGGGIDMATIIQHTSPMMQGDNIKALQAALNGLGYDCGTADGKAGTKTMAGIKAFVEAHSGLIDVPALPDTATLTVAVGDQTYSIEMG